MKSELSAKKTTTPSARIASKSSGKGTSKLSGGVRPVSSADVVSRRVRQISHVRVVESPDARRSERIPADQKALMRRMAKLVSERELGSRVRAMELQIVIISDSEMLELNNRMLGHNWFTDILTFELERESEKLSAEIYVSLERAKENARKFHNSLDAELVRIISHGVLHLAGYDDHTAEGKKRMRARERFFISSSGVRA